MKVESFLKKWQDVVFEDMGGQTSPQYKKFETGFRSVLKDLSPNLELHSFSKNHYECSAVMKDVRTGKFKYVSISDVRYWPNEWMNKILIRTMKHDKDWTGGMNMYSSLSSLAKNLERL